MDGSEPAPFFCLRVDLSALPWDDSPGAAMEPIVLGRLLGLGRTAGLRFHAFATPDVLRAFPAYAEAILGEGHDLDPLGRADFDGVLPNHAPKGCAILPGEEIPSGLAFVSGIEPFPILPAATDPFPLWVEGTRRFIRSHAARGRSVTLAVAAGEWGLVDPKLDTLRSLVSLVLAAGLPMRTLREISDGAPLQNSTQVKRL